MSRHGFHTKTPEKFIAATTVSLTHSHISIASLYCSGQLLLDHSHSPQCSAVWLRGNGAKGE